MSTFSGEDQVTADKVQTDLSAKLIIATYASNRVHADKEKPDKESPDYPLYLGKMQSRRSRGLKVNPNSEYEHQYDQDRWIAENQAAIDAALTAGANIVCLGEFDFPPLDVEGNIKTKYESSGANMAHRRWIKRRLAQHARPAIVFAGSSHVWTEHGCANVGEMFVADNVPQGGVKVHYKQYLK